MLVVPFSLKVAMTAGAITGGAIALLNNKEKLWLLSESILQKGADYCKQKAAHKVIYADDLDELDNESDIDTEYEMSTPNETENEWEDDLD